MAEEADDRRVRDQLKVLTGLKLPGFNWNANNMRMEFNIFWQTLTFMLEGMEIPKDKWYLYILQQLGREGMARWTTSIEATVNKKDPLAIINAFKKGYELEETYWTYQSLYLSSEKQGRGETVATLATRVEDLVSMCKWPDNQKEQRCIDLYYHLSEVFDVRCFIQIETNREGGNLMWEKLVEEGKRQECVGKEYAKFRRERWQWHTILRRSSLGCRRHIQGVQQASAEITDTVWRQRRQEPEAVRSMRQTYWLH